MFKKILIGIVILFAIIGFFFTTVFFAMQFGLLNVRGSSIERNKFFTSLTKADENKDTSCITKNSDGTIAPTCNWNNTEEWKTLSTGLIKDKDVIDRVSKETGVSSRMIVASVTPEQLRYFTSNRESFKKYFEPLKILSSLSKFSLGVSGIKQETAVQIEGNLNNSFSPFYLGKEFENIITYPENQDRDTVLYNRLTDPKDHYYSYLYTALFIKQIQSQWQNAGYNADARPDVIVTLFNIGFKQSIPKPNPETGGANIVLGDKTYSFGELGTIFYNSDELIDVFPK